MSVTLVFLVMAPCVLLVTLPALNVVDLQLIVPSVCLRMLRLLMVCARVILVTLATGLPALVVTPLVLNVKAVLTTVLLVSHPIL